MKCSLFSLVLMVTLWASPAFSDFDSTAVDVNLNATARPDHIMLTWSDDPATTQTVSFRTAPGVVSSSVVYRKDGGGGE
jgi:hypothetical protein